MNNIIDKDTILQVIRQGTIHNVKHYNVSFSDGTKKTMRLFCTSYGEIAEYRKGSRKYGYPVKFDNVTEIKPAGKTKVILTPRQKAIDDYQKKRKLILNNTNPNIWHDLTNAYRELTDQKLEEIADLSEKNMEVEKATGKLFFNDYSYQFYKAMGSILPKAVIDGSYKRLSVKGTMPKYYDRDRVIGEIRQAMDNNKPYRNSWVKGYDYSVSVENGKAFLNQEYRGCGNGHYYLLLDENTALFCEDD